MPEVSTVYLVMAERLIRGTYHGGAYIDLHFGDDAEAFDVINVYDYAKGESTIPNTKDAVLKEMVEYRDAAGESLGHDLREHAIAIGRERP